MRRAKQVPQFPPVISQHLIEWFLEIGPTTAGGMGNSVVSWAEMEAWQQLTGIELEPWEARTIREMSRNFLAQQINSKQPTCPPPMATDEGASDDQVSSAFAAMFKTVAKSGKKLSRHATNP